MGKRKAKSGKSAAARPPLSSAAAAGATTAQKKKAAVLSIPSHLVPRNDNKNNNMKSTSRKFGKIQCLSKGTVWVQTNFFSPLECQEWINWTSQESPSSQSPPSPLWEYTTQRATKYMAHRECFRIQRNDGNIAQGIFDRLVQSGLLHCLQQQIVYPDAQYRPVACNPNIRLYRYGPQMSFGKHIDGSHSTAVGQTEITLLIYLSQCQGGATRFYRESEASSSFAFDPQMGAILLHVHGDRCLEHEADPVLDGTKYVLRTDVCYRKAAVE